MRRCLLFGIGCICQHWLSSLWWHYRSGVSCITVKFYCLSAQRRISPRTFSLWMGMEAGQLCAGMLHQGAVFCLHHLLWAPSTGSLSQTHPCHAQLRNSPPRHSAQQQPAGFVGLVSSEEPLSGHPCLTSPTGAQRARLLQPWWTCHIHTVRAKLLTSLQQGKAGMFAS